MLDDSSIRLLATLGFSAFLGTWMRKRSTERLRQWKEDPAAARERAIRGATLSSGAVAYLGSTVISVLVVLFVEAVVALEHYIT